MEFYRNFADVSHLVARRPTIYHFPVEFRPQSLKIILNAGVVSFPEEPSEFSSDTALRDRFRLYCPLVKICKDSGTMVAIKERYHGAV